MKDFLIVSLLYILFTINVVTVRLQYNVVHIIIIKVCICRICILLTDWMIILDTCSRN